MIGYVHGEIASMTMEQANALYVALARHLKITLESSITRVSGTGLRISESVHQTSAKRLLKSLVVFRY